MDSGPHIFPGWTNSHSYMINEQTHFEDCPIKQRMSVARPLKIDQPRIATRTDQDVARVQIAVNGREGTRNALVKDSRVTTQRIRQAFGGAAVERHGLIKHV